MATRNVVTAAARAEAGDGLVQVEQPTHGGWFEHGAEGQVMSMHEVLEEVVRVAMRLAELSAFLNHADMPAPAAPLASTANALHDFVAARADDDELRRLYTAAPLDETNLPF